MLWSRGGLTAPQHRSSPNGRAQRAFRRLLSPRAIITKVNAIFHRLFHKTERAPMHDTFEALEEWDLLAGETEHVQTPHHETREERVQGQAGGLALIEALPSEVLLEIFDCHRLLAKTSGPSNHFLGWSAFGLDHRTRTRWGHDDITIIHDFRFPSPSASGTIQLKISCDDVDRQMSILVHVGRQFSRLLSSVETVNADGSPSLFSLRDQRETDSAKWLEILRHFRGVRKLEVTGALVPNIASALEQVTGNMARGILPFLRDLHLHGSESSTSPSIEPFVAARRLSSHPVSVHYSRDDLFDNLSDE
ncbi:hypothetical protein H4582DRAFT_2059064 [Lactarius indigo]|nr:hypothetical protein H4582DRAFT_2059064 [Lactarius indigo]